jgi:hypothetical protein
MATVQEPGGLSEAEKRRIKAEVEYRNSLEAKKKPRFSLVRLGVALVIVWLLLLFFGSLAKSVG